MRDASLVPSMLIDAAEFARMLSVSKPTIWRLLSSQKIPEPIRLTSQCLRWRRDVALRWIEAGCPSFGVGDAAQSEGDAA